MSTVGQTGTPPSDFVAGFEIVQTSAAMPAAGVVRSFHFQSSTCNLERGAFDFQVLRPLGSDQYRVLGDTGNQTDPCDSQFHSYSVNIPVQAGDVIGVYVVKDWQGLLDVGRKATRAAPTPKQALQSLYSPSPGWHVLTWPTRRASAQPGPRERAGVLVVACGARTPPGDDRLDRLGGLDEQGADLLLAGAREAGRRWQRDGHGGLPCGRVRWARPDARRRRSLKRLCRGPPTRGSGSRTIAVMAPRADREAMFINCVAFSGLAETIVGPYVRKGPEASGWVARVAEREAWRLS